MMNILMAAASMRRSISGIYDRAARAATFAEGLRYGAEVSTRSRLLKDRHSTRLG